MSTKDLSKWAEMYRSRIGSSYPAYCRQQYRPFLQAIRDYMDACPIGVIREEGCGIATITKILVQDADLSRFDFAAFDSNLEQVRNAESNLAGENADVAVFYGDIFDKFYPVELIHSHGVLEHFSDEDIQRILDRQLSEAKIVVHYVPLIGWDHQSYGDERLLPIDHWKVIHKPTYWQTFNNGKDAVLVWRR
ncbi:hypothetical protein QNH07_gp02 [Aeromonas phage BUCT696]|uniref:hypothetical protein n=1 Tax=Aeromonas phage BUCT696 TaxID=2911664 RepID=UPI0024ADA951|nr:hypothetical protein QNH07_gp02 [Aeromonas phage BUCT696]UKH48767.1 hypothetical protein [Aeromonas phage BUCT696]